MPYIVDIKGSHDRAGEISVVQSDFNHGIRSYGWFDNDRKILIAGNGGPCEYTWRKDVWEGLIALAELIADDLNRNQP